MENTWPRLRAADWTETRDTLHMWTQIVGKIRMAYAPMANHWWHVTLYPTARGLTTSAVPYDKGVFDIEFDFVDERLRLRTSESGSREVVLEPKPVATFYGETFEALAGLGLEPSIHPVPNEVELAIPFAEDNRNCSYDGEAARLFWRQLLQAERVLGRFRSEFVGKASPVHFFWGAMDLAYTRRFGRSRQDTPRVPPRDLCGRRRPGRLGPLLGGGVSPRPLDGGPGDATPRSSRTRDRCRRLRPGCQGEPRRGGRPR